MKKHYNSLTWEDEEYILLMEVNSTVTALNEPLPCWLTAGEQETNWFTLTTKIASLDLVL